MLRLVREAIGRRCSPEDDGSAALSIAPSETSLAVDNAFPRHLQRFCSVEMTTTEINNGEQQDAGKALSQWSVYQNGSIAFILIVG